MSVLDERSETSPSWLRPGRLDMVKGDGWRMGCLRTWLRWAYELQRPNWHCVHYRALSSKAWVVERHTDDDEGKLSVDDQKKEC